MSDTEECTELDVDLNDCRGNEWVDFCAKQLGTEKGINHMRTRLQKWKSTGGEGKTPGNYDALFDKMKTILGAETEDDTEPLKQLLEGTGTEDFSDFSVSLFSSASEETKLDFMKMLNVIGWIKGEKGFLD